MIDIVQYDLGQLIDHLNKHDPNKKVRIGFNNPHSYRGYYDELAFEPAENITVVEMLAAAHSALGATYQGYKGGDFTMKDYTPVWISRYGGLSGQGIGSLLMYYMLGEDHDEE